MHPIDRPSQLPGVLQRIIAINAKKTVADINRERTDFAKWLADKAVELKEANRLILASLHPAVRKILMRPNGYVVNVALIDYLSELSESPDTNLGKCFREGFPVVGEIEFSGAYRPVSSKLAWRDKITVDELDLRRDMIYQDLFSRHKRPSKADHARRLWEASLEDINNEYAEGPFYAPQQVSDFLGCRNWFPAPRFACDTLRPAFSILQEAGMNVRSFEMKRKVRAIDDLHASQVNDAAVIKERLVLPGVDSIGAHLRLLRETHPHEALSGFAVDQVAAFRTIPLMPGHRKYGVTQLWDEDRNVPAWMVLQGLSFGSAASMQSYCRVSRFIQHVARKVFKLPLTGYIDDYWLLDRADCVPSARHLVSVLFESLGFQVESSKDQCGSDLILLGARFQFSGSNIRISIPELKKIALCEQLQEILDRGTLSPAEAGKIKGKLLWALSHLFGQIGKPYLFLLSQRQYLPEHCRKSFDLTKALRKGIEKLKTIITQCRPRVLSSRRPAGDSVILLTDGMQKNGEMGVGGIVFDPHSDRAEFWSGKVPHKASKDWVANDGKKRSNEIMNVELYAVLSSLKHWGPKFVGRRMICFIDNSSSFCCLCKAGAREDDSRAIIVKIHELICKYNLNVWFDWVASDSNLADAPSRMPTMSKAERRRARAKLASAHIHEVNINLVGT